MIKSTEKFLVVYDNHEPHCELNGKQVLVQTSVIYPHHYIQADGKHTADGRLAKKYCTLVTPETVIHENFNPIVLKPENFDATGRLILASLTIQDCFNLWRDYHHSWISRIKFTEYYRMSDKEFNLIKQIHDKAEAIIIHRQLRENRT